MENTNPVIFNNVQVWAAKAAYNFPPADAYIRDLSYVNLGNYCKWSFTKLIQNIWNMKQNFLIFSERTYPRR